jgi:thiamine pyrophosphokinase
MNILVLGSGNVDDYNQIEEKLLKSYDYIISVDGGAKHLEPLDLKPDLLIGDFDSIDYELLNQYKDIADVESYNSEKDETDSELAFMKVEELKPEIVHVVGFLGGRTDHTLNNVMLLIRYKNINIQLIDEKNIVFYCNKSCKIQKREGYYLSLLVLSDIKGLNLSGVKYPLIDKNIKFPSSLTISNQIIENEASIEYSEGKLIAILSKD